MYVSSTAPKPAASEASQREEEMPALDYPTDSESDSELAQISGIKTLFEFTLLGVKKKTSILRGS